MPTPRKEIANAAAVLDGRIWVAGGVTPEGRISDALESYDPATDGWQSHAPLPEPLWRAVLAAADGRLYLFGGYRSTGRFPFDPTDAVYAYDPRTDTWSARSPMPAGPRGAFTAVTAGGRIHVIGGAQNNGLDRHEVYDPATDRWSTAPALPTPRSGLSAALLGREIVTTGGYVLGAGGVRSFATVEAYDLDTGAWRALPDLPAARFGVGAAALGGRLYVFGGLASDEVPSRALVYDPSKGVWNALPEMPSPVSFMGVAALEGSIHVVGGGPVPLDRHDAVPLHRVFVPDG